MKTIGMMIFAVLTAAVPASAGDAQTSDQEPFRVNAYLCETPQYAIAFAVAIGRGEDEELAKDSVGRAAEQDVCGKYIGLASVKEQKTMLSNGVMYKLTALRFTEDDRIAWMAEAAAATNQ